jgi:phosphoribosylamine--glycine ligase
MTHTLVVGSGGREHALVKSLKNSAANNTVYAWPGSAGIFLDALEVPVARGDFTALATWCVESQIDLIVIGPEVEIVAGLSDILRARGLNVFAPSQEAAQLEGSKTFAKEFMREFNIPTARDFVVTSVSEVLLRAQEFKPPYVLKADGLAAGKGVFICADLSELELAAKNIFELKKFGDAGETAILEEFHSGRELSVLVLTNGADFEVLPLSRDHKRLSDNDLGPNTGGMGVVAPIQIDQNLYNEIIAQVVQPTIQGIKKRKYLYRGVIFIGLMLTPNGPRVLEYNVRFGDPETQAILPLLCGDWYEVLNQVARGNMLKLEWKNLYTACVVLAAEGYPDQPIRGAKISGELLEGSSSFVLHAGTKSDDSKKVGSEKSISNFMTDGGRVLNVVGVGRSLEQALNLAYEKVRKISWPGMQYRKDIGR